MLGARKKPSMQEKRQRTAPAQSAGLWWVRSVIERFSCTLQGKRQRTAPTHQNPLSSPPPLDFDCVRNDGAPGSAISDQFDSHPTCIATRTRGAAPARLRALPASGTHPGCTNSVIAKATNPRLRSR